MIQSILGGLMLGAILVGIVALVCAAAFHTMDNYQGEGDE